MSVRWYVVRRVAWAVVATYLVLSVTWALVALPGNPNEMGAAFAAAARGDSAYAGIRDQSRPLLDRYLDWLVGFSTLQWGRSETRFVPVTEVVAGAVPVTLTYVVPAVLLAAVGGVAVGLATVATRRRWPERLVTAGAYLGMSLPNFWLATLLLLFFGGHLGWIRFAYDPESSVWAAQNAKRLALAAVVLASYLVASQVRYARAESAEYVAADFVTTARAKGAGRLRVGWHVLRNAVVPLVALFFADLLAVLVFTAYIVEVVFGIPGLGQVSYDAIRSRDVPLVVATVLVPVLFGIVGNLVQDLLYAALDPRIGVEG